MNAGAGSVGSARSAQRASAVLEACRAAGLDATVHPCEPAQLAATVRAAIARDVDAVIAAGGDGTVSAVAGALAGGSIPLAVLPLGTLNHFARDLGVPLDLAAAARAIAGAEPRWIDVAELNGRVFVNNSSIGLYPETVLTRDAVRRRTGARKWIAMARAAARVLRRFPLLRVRIATGDRVIVARTPFVFVGNNPYTINLLQLGQRPRLDDGQLSLYMVRSTTRLKMFWLMVRAILQRLDAVRDFEAHTSQEVMVATGKHRIRVALDGEVVVMTPPLRYRIRPHALCVLAPPAAAALRPAAVQASSPAR